MATAKRDLSNPQVQGPLLSVQEACALMGVSLATLYRYMADGHLRFGRRGGARVIAKSDLLECKDNRKFRDRERTRLQRRAAAHALHSMYDSREVTKAARDAFFRRFEVIVDPDAVLPEKERKRRAEQAKKAYFTDLARRSSKARRAGRRGSRRKG